VRIAPKWNWETCCLRKAFCPTSAAPIEAGDLMDRPNSQILRCELVYVLLCYFLADEVVVLFHVRKLHVFFGTARIFQNFLKFLEKI
jgi:hypothetical protein